MRIVLGCVAALALCGWTRADDKDEKIDAKKLVGKWTTENKELGAKLIVNFAKDGKLAITVKAKGEKDVQIKGTYKLTGNQLTMTMEGDGKEHKETLTVLELDEDDLVTKDPKGNKDTYKRVEEDDK
ncbi:Lipocalin-like protein [Gemmata obscuriglobus]|uniref:TIGR03066 family protein n=1 Tax=Gemmata obscuriglobus TaxID=114 RepID=A0A2Z3H6S4_9BACT|nr:TIGR03066 family protein [Gemmata obscuriglobus]AWM36670.1 TIGR03066 family protein [Gemmata obscuriglobus]QEG30689.1 Lipocalin-like protein [Gemmata obscuriglobus]VTS10016.1 : Lipocalin_3 [Gemmata obscuriglobus UQM 2246]